MLNYLLLAATIAVLILTLGAAGTADLEEAERARAHYCDMVETWHDTNGRAGWPPYDGDC